MKLSVKMTQEMYNYINDAKTSDYLMGQGEISKMVNAQLDDYYRDAIFEKSAILFAERGDLRGVRQVIEAGGDVNIKNFFGETLLMIAAKRGDVCMMKYLFENNADIKARNNVDMTPLILAAAFGKLESVKLLLAKGSDIKEQDGYERTALKAATSKGRLEVVKYLINDKGCEVPSDILSYTKIPCSDNLGRRVKEMLWVIPLQSVHQDSYGFKDGYTLLNLLSSKIGADWRNDENIGTMTGYLIHIGSVPGAKLESSFELISSETGKKLSPSIPEDLYHEEGYFYAGVFAGNLISPGLKYIDDQITGKNKQVTLYDNYASIFDGRALAKSAIMSITTYSLPRNIDLHNKIIIGKMIGDAVFSGIDLSPEYAASILVYLANYLASATVAGSVLQTTFYKDHPFSTGVIATIAGDMAKLWYHSFDEGIKMISGEDSSQQNVDY